ncbi:MAG: hypothetical protein PHT07_10515 [Paludibacter sp.]|nr:hypothetical protein [Paludibacter sp.]
MQNNFDKTTLSLITGDTIHEIENSWYGKTFAHGKNGYYVVSIPSEQDKILIETYESKERFSAGAEPKSTYIDRSMIDSNQIIEPSQEIIALLYNRSIHTIRVIYDDLGHFPIYERETVTIQFVDGTVLFRSLYALAEEFKYYCGKHDLITTSTTSETLTCITAIDSDGKEFLSSINRKSYMAAFDLAEKVRRIKTIENII